MSGEYAAAGVDYRKINPFKEKMRETARRTLRFPERRGVKVIGAGPLFTLNISLPITAAAITEGGGDKSWIAEWMYAHTRDASWFSGIAVDATMMAVVDVLREGGLPVIYTCKISAGSSDWFTDEARRDALADGYYKACRLSGMALVQGESASLPVLMDAANPIVDAPSLSGCALGIVPRPLWLGSIREGDLIFGVASSGLHANGASLLIEKAMRRPAEFLELLPNGRVLGEEALIPTRCYVSLVEALIERGIGGIRAIEPLTGGGVASIFKRDDAFTYRIQHWVEPPPIFEWFLRIGVSLQEGLSTFNWGIGLYFMISERYADEVVAISSEAGWELVHLGRVEKGERKVIFDPEGIELLPR